MGQDAALASIRHWVDPSGISIGCLSGVGALWDCVPRVCGGKGGCAGGGVPLGAVPVLSWCGEVSRGYTIIIK